MQTPYIASRRVLVASLVWFGVYLCVRTVLARDILAHPWDLVVACVTVPAFYLFVWEVQQALKGADELQRRIHLEALALAFPTTMLLLMTLGLLDSLPAQSLGLPLNNLWAMLPPLWGLCFAVADRKYR
jgi:hypothetical protein